MNTNQRQRLFIALSNSCPFVFIRSCNPGFEVCALFPYARAMQHSPGFLKLVDDAKTRISEISIEQARARLAANPNAVLLDVREESEWTAGHAVEAKSLGKGESFNW